MVKRTRKSQKSQSKTQELVVVAIADTLDEAKDYETLLKTNEIPAMVRQQQDEFSDSKRYVVMVPEEMTDEAHVIIESQDAYDDFYDSARDDENADDLDNDIFEEGS
jgi:predicted secreted acid phosphatase